MVRVDTDETVVGNCENQFIRTITYIATDDCGNESEPYTITITTGDGAAPVWDQEPGSLDLSFTCSEDVVIPATPTASDNCSSAVVTVAVESDVTTPGNCNNNFTRVITYVASDDCGNLSTAYTITIIVNDNSVPTWDITPGTLDTTFTCTEDLVLPTAPTATDNCGSAIVTVTAVSYTHLTLPTIYSV